MLYQSRDVPNQNTSTHTQTTEDGWEADKIPYTLNQPSTHGKQARKRANIHVQAFSTGSRSETAERQGETEEEPVNEVSGYGRSAQSQAEYASQMALAEQIESDVQTDLKPKVADSGMTEDSLNSSTVVGSAGSREASNLLQVDLQSQDSGLVSGSKSEDKTSSTGSNTCGSGSGTGSGNGSGDDPNASGSDKPVSVSRKRRHTQGMDTRSVDSACFTYALKEMASGSSEKNSSNRKYAKYNNMADTNMESESVNTQHSSKV